MVFQDFIFIDVVCCPYGGWTANPSSDEDNGITHDEDQQEKESKTDEDNETTRNEGEGETDDKNPSSDEEQGGGDEGNTDTSLPSTNTTKNPLLDFSGFFTPDDNPVKVPDYTNGGGPQMDTSGKVAKDLKFTAALERLANGIVFQKVRGTTEWDGKKLATIILTHQYAKLEQAKHGWRPRKVYFVVDTSGSVMAYAKVITKMIASAKESQKIVLYSGSEAWPQLNVRTQKKLAYCRRSFHESFLKMVEGERMDSDSTVVFWGDLQMSLDRVLARQTMSKYNCIWLNPNEKGEMAQYYPSVESYMEQICPVIYGMDTIEKIIFKLKQIVK